MEKKLSKSDLREGMNSQNRIYITLIGFMLFLAFSGCQDYGSDINPETNTSTTAKKFKTNNDYTQVNLVSDVAKYGAQTIDINLVNAWGFAFNTTGIVWISSAEANASTIYDQNGAIRRTPVSVPGNPTGQVFNSDTSLFINPLTKLASRFIFATENGTIAAWASGIAALTVVDRSAQGAVYKGLELVNNDGKW